VTGVGGPAVNAVILADTPVGSEADAADRMVSFWQDAANAQLGKDWIGGVGTGLLVKGALYDDSDALDFLKTQMADVQASERWVDIALTDMTSG